MEYGQLLQQKLLKQDYIDVSKSGSNCSGDGCSGSGWVEVDVPYVAAAVVLAEAVTAFVTFHKQSNP